MSDEFTAQQLRPISEAPEDENITVFRLNDSGDAFSLYSMYVNFGGQVDQWDESRGEFVQCSITTQSKDIYFIPHPKLPAKANSWDDYVCLDTGSFGVRFDREASFRRHYIPSSDEEIPQDLQAEYKALRDFLNHYWPEEE